jgi:membrane associated rhomboid family serine protease
LLGLCFSGTGLGIVGSGLGVMRATNLLILLCILVSLYSWIVDPAFVERNLAFSLNNILQGRVWTTVTAIFVHANLLHLAGNMIFLYVFGNTLESVTGDSRKMLSAFFLGGLLSFPLSIPFFPPDASFVGASAAIFTLTAVVMLLKPLRWSWLLLMPVGLVAVLYFLYNALAVYFQFQSDVAYVSHIIGFSLGLPLGIAWSQKWKKNLLISIGLLVVYFILLFFVTQYVLPKL